MITIIRYRNDTYYGLEGRVEHPTRTHSGYAHEDIELAKSYKEKLEDFEEKRKNATFLNKIHAKRALDTEILGWEEKFGQESRDIEYKINHVHGFSGNDQLWKKDYTFYHLNNFSIEDLTKPTEEA